MTQEMVQADQENDLFEENAEASDEVPELSGSEIADAHGKRDGSLKALLDRKSTELVDEFQYKAFRRIYAEATNSSKCPCGSGALFLECCKASWQLLDRSYHARKKEVRQAVRDEARKQGLANMSLVLEVRKDGTFRMRTLDGTTPMPPPYVLEQILHEAWLNVVTSNIIGIVQRKMVPSQAPGRGGIILPK